MTDLDDRVRGSLQSYGASVDVAPARLDDVVGRARWHRRRTVGIGTGMVLVAGAVVALVVTADDDAGRSVVPATEPSVAPLLAPGEVEALPPAPTVPGLDPAAVWTGEEMIIWGGGRVGGEYWPATHTWLQLPAAPPASRSDAGAVWTGAEMLVWGGGADGTSMSDGVAYNPATRTWRVLPPFALDHTIRPTTIWTGTEMIVLEGINGTNRGGAYNPSTNSWREIAAPPGRSVTPYPQAVWTGDRMVVELGTGSDDQPVVAEYDPVADTWQLLDAPAIPPNARPKLLWTGTEVLILGSGPNVAWNPSTRRWREIAPPDETSIAATPVWTGDAAVFWISADSSTAYVPATDEWRTIDGPGVRPRTDPVLLWADGVVLSWGGWSNNADGSMRFYSDGLAWRPDLQSDGSTSPSLPEPTVATDVAATTSTLPVIDVAGLLSAVPGTLSSPAMTLSDGTRHQFSKPATLTIEQGPPIAVDWYLACNSRRGEVRAGAASLQLANITQTLVACPQRQTDEDAWLEELMSGSPSVTVADDGTSLAFTNGPETITFTSESAIRVELADGCPASVAGHPDGSDTAASWTANPDSTGLVDTFVPGTPASALICRYAASGESFSTTPLGSEAAAVLAATLNDIEPWDFTAGCLVAQDSARYTAIVFAVPGRTDVDVWLKDWIGCPEVTNGVRASGELVNGQGSAFLAQLDTVAAPATPAG